MKSFNIALIGLGGVSDVHLHAYQQLENCHIIAGADINKEILKEKAEKWNFKPYTDYNEMLSKEDIDVVSILTPARYHEKVVLDCAKQGVHILCEKPLTLNTRSAMNIIKICAENEVYLGYGSSYRWLTAVQTARKMINSGKLGRIQLAMELSIGGQGLEGFQPAGEHHYPKGTPGGGMMGLVDHGIHLLDILPWLLDSPIQSVFGRGNISGEKPQPEYITLFFENGAIGQLLYDEITYSTKLPTEGIASFGGSWDIDGNLQVEGHWANNPGNIHIYGDKGALRIFHYAEKLFFFQNNKIIPIPLQHSPMPGNFVLQMQAFLTAIEKNDKYEPSGHAGLRALCVLEAIYRSMESQKVEKVHYIS